MSERLDQTAAALLQALRGILSDVAEPSQLLKTILAQSVSRTGADRGIFVEVDRSGKLAYRVLYRFHKDELRGEAGRFSRSVFQRVLDSGEGLSIDNAQHDPRFMTKESIQDFRLTSILCMPIELDGKVRALVHLESNRPGHFTEEHQSILRSLLELASPALATLQASEGVIRERDSLRQQESRAREELEESRELLARDFSFGRFIGRSPAVRELEQKMARAAKTDFPVLVTGETGTGKSILARVLHFSGPRAKRTFATVFCPSLEKGMVESELFGHRRGAFTGAVSDRVGKVQAADKGTLFLDEIGELPKDIQAKLLRLLQEKTYERLGDPAEHHADVRVIAATNRDLEEEVREGRFRRDLYERLNFLPIRVPPLRERREDIPLLLRYFVDKYEVGRWLEFEEDAIDFLRGLDFTWPGNVRHLEHLAARLSMETRDEPVTREDLCRLLDTSAQEREADPGAVTADLEQGLPALLAQEEKKWLEEALKRHPEKTRAEIAATLKISEAALYKKLRQYGIGR